MYEKNSNLWEDTHKKKQQQNVSHETISIGTGEREIKSLWKLMRYSTVAVRDRILESVSASADKLLAHDSFLQ